jgi:hypothetical protein
MLASEPGTELMVNEYDWEGHAYKLTLKNATFTAWISLREYKEAIQWPSAPFCSAP